jgi:uncharacterized metal-binding protein YceD (DUF177 family)
MKCFVWRKVPGSARVMHLSLRSVQHAHERVEQRYEPSLFPMVEGDAFRVVSPVLLSFDIDRQETGRYRLAGVLTSEVELACSRCLEPLTWPVATSFDLRYVPRTENAGEGEREVEEDDLATAFYDDDQIDLGHLVMEQLHLALPMKPLCSDVCNGLCPECGTNLNTGACNCSSTWEDPRLAVLKKLKTNS